MINGSPNIYTSSNYLVLDFETTGHYRDASAHIVLACWSRPAKRSTSSSTPAPVLPHHLPLKSATEAAVDGLELGFEWGSEVALHKLRAAIASSDFVVAHNAKFEAGWLQRMGVDTRKLVFYDTMMCEWVFHAGLPPEKGRLSLDGCAARYSVGVKGEYCKLLLALDISASLIPTEELLTYCFDDVLLTNRLFEKQKQKLKEKATVSKKLLTSNSSSFSFDNYVGLHNIVYCRSMLSPVLADIETRGLQLDQEAVLKEHSELIAKREALSVQLYELTGGINLSSNKQLADFLYDKLHFTATTMTAGNARSTSIDTVESLHAKTPEQKLFKSLYLEYNDIAQSLSKYMDLFKGVCEERGGLLSGNLNQGNTVTHRLASSGVPFKAASFKKAKSAQFQNLPRDCKKLFKAKREGWLIGECDGSQLEFRIAAALSADPVAIQEITDLVDVHAITASVLKVSRQDAKASTFAPLYGGNGKDKAEKNYCKFFKQKYADISATQRSWVDSVLMSEHKELVLPYGMVYHFPTTRMQSDGYVVGTTNIYNYPVQGLATAECIPIALAYMWHHLPDEGIEIVNTVHDSIIAEVRPDMVDVWLDLCLRAMTYAVYEFVSRVYGYSLEVPLGLGAKIGERWGVGNERTFQLDREIMYEIVKDVESGAKKKIRHNGTG